MSIVKALRPNQRTVVLLQQSEWMPTQETLLPRAWLSVVRLLVARLPQLVFRTRPA